MSTFPSSPTSFAGFAVLSEAVLTSVIAPLLTTSDLLALASTDRVTRQLLLSSSLWRHKVFRSLPRCASCVSSPLPSLFTVVQQLRVQYCSGLPDDWSSPFLSLVLFPNLRHLRFSTDSLIVRSPSPPVASFHSLRHLTRRSHLTGCLNLDSRDLKLLSTLPALQSFTAEHARFGKGNVDTLRQWRADTVETPPHSSLSPSVSSPLLAPTAAVAVGQERKAEEDDPRVIHQPLLLFLHALAPKPSFVHLRLFGCDIDPFVVEHMPVWPHLRCLSLVDDELHHYPFAQAALRFPSLTSLTSPNRSDEAIANLVQLPQLQELRFEFYSNKEDGEYDGVQTTAKGFHTFSQAASLRSLFYSTLDVRRSSPPSLDSLTAVFTLTNLTRLTLNAYWLNEAVSVPLFTQHRFVHLRCLELVSQFDVWHHICPQTDVALLPLVKPADFFVPGRAERQAARAVEELNNRERRQRRDGDQQVEEPLVIPEGREDNFPSLECLALPYSVYDSEAPGGLSGTVSEWMKRQLRRSYEFEVASEWEAETETLGEAELLKSLAKPF